MPAITASDRELFAAIPASTLVRYREMCAGASITGDDVRDNTLFAMLGYLPTLQWVGHAAAHAAQ
ncbi:MAG: hypothetical protein V3R27_02780 [Pseudomonadales bacterium]